jgi:large subunit ribosomal protein L4
MPKQMRRLAIRSVLSAKLRDERVTVIEGLMGIEPKTKTMKSLIEKLPESRSVLIVVSEKNDTIDRATGNLPNVHSIVADVVNVRDVLKYERLVVTPEAIEKIEELWALSDEKRTPSAFKQARLAAANAEVEA